MDAELSPQQTEKVLHIIDILGLEDFTLATALLQQAGWNLEKAIGFTDSQPIKQEKPLAYATQENMQFYDYTDQNDDEQDQYEYNQYQQVVEKQEEFNNKKTMFNNEYISIPLTKTTSEVPNFQEKKLLKDKQITKELSKYRHDYQTKLIKNAELFYDRILANSNNSLSQEKERSKLMNSKLKNQKNRKFIVDLHQRYKTRINFTFGTLMLNLARSHLDNKCLLVYVHRSEFQNNKSIEMLLTQKQIANFINKNCITYGMFDSSDDYQIVQKYVPLKNTPAFVLFKFDKQNKKEHFMGEYIILQKEPTNFLEWLSYNIGLTIKKKEKTQEKIKEEEDQLLKIKEQEEKAARFMISDIINEQNSEYQEMSKIYQMKRQKSRLKKQEIAQVKEQIQKMKQNFKNEPTSSNIIAFKFRLPLTGKSIIRNFQQNQRIQRMFEYINCFGRQQFEDEWADFDLTQTFPKLSLYDQKKKTIEEVFEGSQQQNIIVKQL